MKKISPRPDFIIVENFFNPQQAQRWIELITKLGSEEGRGFHHPNLKPSRFHKSPKYPVKKFMCLGLYWNPLDYNYYEMIPESTVKPQDIPDEIRLLSSKVLEDFYPYPHFRADSVMVNFYTKDSSMGLHVDKDEPFKGAPIVGLNFGSSCRFYYEDLEGLIKHIIIPGNSIYIFGGSARLMRHGLGTIYSKTLSPGSEKYLKDKERINLTIRQVYS